MASSDRQMRHLGLARKIALFLSMAISVLAAAAQAGTAPVTITVVDENGVGVSGARIVVGEAGRPDLNLASDFAGRCTFTLQEPAPYTIRIQKPGFYESASTIAEAHLRDVRVVLYHEQIVMQQVSVTASPPGIDTTETSDRASMNLAEITNVPYPTSRDIRNLLPFFPGVVQDETGQVHVAGSETWATLDTLDSFDIRSPVSGNLAMRVSADAVRSIDQESTRYPVEFGRSTGGVIALYTGMGTDKFRFNATDFIPSFQQNNGIHFDKFVPRLTLSGPLVRGRAWFFDGLEVEYDNNYIKELPAGANTNHLIRGSNLIRAQENLSDGNILSGGLLFNDYHAPYDGLSPLVPQQSTVNRDTIAWLPYLRDQQTFHNGALLDYGIGVVRFRDGYEPHPDGPFEITPELYRGSFFEALTSHSQRIEGNAALYVPPQHLAGVHNIKTGIDLDHIGFDENVSRLPVNYLREDGTLLRQSVFPATPPFTRHNVEVGAYVQDQWSTVPGLLVEPGLRFDWDEIIRQPLFSPRLAAVYAPPAAGGNTKVSAGVGLYYEHTQLEYLTRSLAGLRDDTYFAADGATPVVPLLGTSFLAPYGPLKEARALNWSFGVEQKLPGAVFFGANLIRKQVSDVFTYVNRDDPSGLSGNFVLSSGRRDNDNLVEVEARRSFAEGYTLFAAYTHSSAHTNAAIDYTPTLSMLGPQQSGPLMWDTPNRVISWGWLPFALPWFRKNWDLVYTFDWRTGFPFTAVDANHVVVGAVGAQRFPDYLSISPGLEWRFHFRRSYFGLRGVIENITDSANPAVVNNVTASPEYGTFSETQGRAITARIRLIGSRK